MTQTERDAFYRSLSGYNQPILEPAPQTVDADWSLGWE